MKPFFPLYIAVCVSLVYYSVAMASNPRLEVLGAGEYAIYSREVVTSPLVTRRVASGIGFIYYADSADVAELRAKFDVIDGESIVLDGAVFAREVFKKLGYNQTSSNGGIYYGYSPRALAFIKTSGQKVNLQVVERNGSTVVGWPVILGGY